MLYLHLNFLKSCFKRFFFVFAEYYAKVADENKEQVLHTTECPVNCCLPFLQQHWRCIFNMAFLPHFHLWLNVDRTLRLLACASYPALPCPALLRPARLCPDLPCPRPAPPFLPHSPLPWRSPPRSSPAMAYSSYREQKYCKSHKLCVLWIVGSHCGSPIHNIMGPSSNPLAYIGGYFFGAFFCLFV